MAPRSNGADFGHTPYFSAARSSSEQRLPAGRMARLLLPLGASLLAKICDSTVQQATAALFTMQDIDVHPPAGAGGFFLAGRCGGRHAAVASGGSGALDFNHSSKNRQGTS